MTQEIKKAMESAIALKNKRPWVPHPWPYHLNFDQGHGCGLLK
jgi:hypothetical protein